MDMQDKEFDQLFRSKLNDLEFEPSGSVWQRINEGLGDTRRKRIIPFLSIAASIIVLVTAGVLFIPKKNAIVKSSVKNRIAITTPSKINNPINIKQQTVAAPNTALAVTTNNPVHLYHTSNNIAKIITVKKELTAKNELPAQSNDQQVLAAASSSKNEVKQAPAVDTSEKLAAITPVLQNNKIIAAVPDKQNAIAPPADKVTDVSTVKKHHIHGIGDLLNVVIAAVDKRKDKVIEFGDSDGDGATITAVNLGIIKLKKEN